MEKWIITTFRCSDISKAHYDFQSGKPPPGESGKIAKLLVFLVSDASEAITGAVIPADQAWSAF